MPSANTELQEQAIQHALYRLGYANAVNRDVLVFLNQLEKDVVEKLAARLATANLKGVDKGPKTTQRMEETIEEIRNLTTNVYSKTHDHLKREFTDYASAEAKNEANSINRAVKAKVANKLPSPQLLNTIVTERPIHGELLKPFVKRLGAGTADRVEQQIRLGMAAGEGVDKIVARVTGVEGFDRSKNAARAMVRTSVNSISNQARLETWRANSELIKGWQFTATLDSRTTPICASLDGKVFDLDDTAALPPRHPQCRSTTVAVTRSHEELGLKGKKYSAETRASMDGQVAAPTTFERFMKSKGEEFQDKILGATRADLWRRGKLNLNDFVRNYSEVIPLDELRRLHPEAFGAETVAEVVTPAAPARFSPINPAITSDSIPMLPLKEIKKRLSADVAEAARDSRYINRVVVRGLKDTDLGKATVPTGLTDEAASLMYGLKGEVDAISEAFNIPKLRGIRSIPTTTNHVMNMGDGTLGINAVYVNGYTGKVESKASVELAKLTARIEELADILKKGREKYADTDGIDFFNEFAAEYREYRDLAQKQFKLKQKVRKTERVATKATTTWKVGDDPEKRPFTADAYFDDPVDRMRSLLYHETAHHVHDYYKASGYIEKGSDGKLYRTIPRIVLELQERFNKFSGPLRKEALATRSAHFPSKYATTQAVEWWAENFSLYMMGRYDLVEPELIDLIEEMLKRARD